MTLIQISDCHLLESPARCGYGDINPLQSLEAVLKTVVSLDVDGVLVTGDISGDDSEQSYQHFIQVINQHLPDIPVKVIAGNHDNNALFDTLLSPWLLTPDNCWQLGEWCIHGLDTRSTGTLGKVDAIQLEHVSAQMQKHANKQHLLAIHHHPVATQSWMDKHALHGVPELERWLTQNPVQAVLHGHIHAEHQTKLANTPVLGVPSTCWQWALTQAFGLDETAPGFRVFDLSTSTLHTEIRRVA